MFYVVYLNKQVFNGAAHRLQILIAVNRSMKHFYFKLTAN